MKIALNILKTIAAAASAVAALDLTGVINILPADIAKWAVIVPTASAAILHGVTTLGDLLDDGKQNGSFLGLLLVAGITATMFPSCTPTHYEANLSDPKYSTRIQQDPSKVLIDVQDVTPIGKSFSPEFRGRVLTDAGAIDISPDGVVGEVVIDLRGIQVDPTK